MRRVQRLPLERDTEADLGRRQAKADRKRAKGTLVADDEWKSARRTRHLKEVLATLRRMMGSRERCMYCLDSHGSDIEHFWPKNPYPDRMFQWPNLLLCCAECGRLKGNRFPLSDGHALLIDPTVEDPWQHLDFDPTTGNVVARFDVATGEWSPKGLQTVEILLLDRREALAAGYRKTFLRLSALVAACLAGESDIEALDASLREVDDHGLLGWCILGGGQSEPPFRELRVKHPEVWQACAETLEQA